MENKRLMHDNLLIPFVYVECFACDVLSFYLFLNIKYIVRTSSINSENTLPTPSISNSQSFDQFHNNGQMNHIYPNDHNRTANKQTANNQFGNLVFETKLKIIEILQVNFHLFFPYF